MKRILTYLALAAMTVMTLASCSEEKRKKFVDDFKKVDEKAFRADVDVKIFKDEVL